jgi:GH43 family beta-xylosidase
MKDRKVIQVLSKGEYHWEVGGWLIGEGEGG